MITVFHIIPTLGVGGAEKLVTDICKNLDKKKFTVNVVTLYKIYDSIFIEELKRKNINIIELNKKVGFDLSIIFKLYKVFKEYKPDVINTHLYVVPYVILPALLRRIKVKVHTVHSIASKEIASKFKRKIMKVAYKYLKFVPIGISDYIKNTILEEYNLKANQVECIYNGIDTSKFVCNNSCIHDNKIIFVNVARMNEAKNQILLLEAFKLVNEKYKNTELHIVGDGELRENIENKIEELNLKGKVILRGIKKDVACELNNSSVFVLSSNYEGLPLSVLEAMSSGLPIITTDAGGVIDIVENNINGIIVEKKNKKALADAMIKMCKDKNCLQEMGKNSYLLSKKYDIKEIVKQYENLYTELINKRKGKNERKRKN